MKKSLIGLLCLTLFFAQGHAAVSKENSKESPLERAKALIKTIVVDNNAYAGSKSHQHYAEFMHSQTPRATLVLCSDSRVQKIVFTKNPENDLFTVRNIGNQVATAEGSVEYGVDHLKTPVLLIMGHSDCGAIKAASKDYSALRKPIRKELDSLDIPKGEKLNKGVILNVHHQVAHAMKLFGHLVKADKLVILGAIYDFRNDFKHGIGKLIFINVNGNEDCAHIAKNSLLKDIPGIHIGVLNCKNPIKKRSMSS